jgi:hypothetical protein
LLKFVQYNTSRDFGELSFGFTKNGSRFDVYVNESRKCVGDYTGQAATVPIEGIRLMGRGSGSGSGLDFQNVTIKAF